MPNLICPQCNKGFYVPKCRLKRNRACCSWKCKILFHEPNFKKGHTPWNRGKCWDKKTLAKIREKAKERTGENNHMWKGDNVGYDAIHDWVKRHKQNPLKCEFCKDTRLLQWANKSGEYKRDLSDWIYLCINCHAAYDKRWLKRKRNKNGQFA